MGMKWVKIHGNQMMSEARNPSSNVGEYYNILNRRVSIARRKIVLALVMASN